MANETKVFILAKDELWKTLSLQMERNEVLLKLFLLQF